MEGMEEGQPSFYIREVTPATGTSVKPNLDDHFPLPPFRHPHDPNLILDFPIFNFNKQKQKQNEIPTCAPPLAPSPSRSPVGCAAKQNVN